MSNNTILFKILGIPSEQQSAVNWHNTIVTGLPKETFGALATELSFSEKQFSQVMGLSLPKKKEVVLSPEVSETLYRVSQALSSLMATTGWDVLKAKTWLRQENALLKNRVPLSLLQSCIGCDYVNTAISRL